MNEVRQAVDDLLLEQGCYTPLELLLGEGRLVYVDYESWRKGEAGDLEDRLFGDPAQTDALLREAELYCKEMGLEAEPISYGVWGGDTAGEIRFSRLEEREQRFRARYRKPSGGHPQLDLFLDATGTTLANGLTQALTEHDHVEARRLLNLLMDTEPGHGRLGALERLLEAAEDREDRLKEPAEALREIRDELRPLAQQTLGPECRDYMVPLWRRLAESLEGVPFDPAKADEHRSYALLQAEDWPTLRASVEKEQEWRRQPLLLQRHARACGRMQQIAEALADWFRICWLYPDATSQLSEEGEADLRSCWLRFLEIEPELPVPSFPSWLLIAQPGLAHHAPTPEAAIPSGAPMSYRLTFALKDNGSSADSGQDLIERRRQLKRCDPLLFSHYMTHAASQISGS